MKKTVRITFFVLLSICLTALTGVVYFERSLPNSFFVEQGEPLSVGRALVTERNAVPAVNTGVGESYTTTVKWLGLFPVKSVSVTVVEERVVTLGGMPFGVKLYTDGVMVVSLSAVDSVVGNVNPARNAGLKVGDQILSINGETVYTNEQVSQIVKTSAGKQLVLRIKRNGVQSEVRFSAVRSVSENVYKAGIWVRDSSAGIGTVTFYDPKAHVIAGLGHAVCDVDTGEIIPIASGEIVPARIFGINKSKAGSPGELRGGFSGGSYGALLKNSVSGVYAHCEKGIGGKTVALMLKQDVRTGAAKMITTISGTQPKEYDIRIVQVRHHDQNATRNMVIEITDPELLEKTGGILQGMSGSPIVQNGKLIGAVTHVLVNDPTRGYAIFAENMLETAQITAKQQLKEVS